MTTTPVNPQEQVARIIKQASTMIAEAVSLIEQHNLGLENYPENWADFAEHPSELQSIMIANYDTDTRVIVGEF